MLIHSATYHLKIKWTPIYQRIANDLVLRLTEDLLSPSVNISLHMWIKGGCVWGTSQTWEEVADPYSLSYSKLQTHQDDPSVHSFTVYKVLSLTWYTRLWLPKEGAMVSASLTSPGWWAWHGMHWRNTTRNHLSLKENYVFQLTICPNCLISTSYVPGTNHHD